MATIVGNFGSSRFPSNFDEEKFDFYPVIHGNRMYCIWFARPEPGYEMYANEYTGHWMMSERILSGPISEDGWTPMDFECVGSEKLLDVDPFQVIR